MGDDPMTPAAEEAVYEQHVTALIGGFLKALQENLAFAGPVPEGTIVEALASTVETVIAVTEESVAEGIYDFAHGMLDEADEATAHWTEERRMRMRMRLNLTAIVPRPCPM